MFNNKILMAVLCVAFALVSCSSLSYTNKRSLPPPLELGGKGQLLRPYRVLVAGDSLSEALGPQLKRGLQGYAGLEIIPIGKSSTGLCRPDFYNWPEVLEKNLQMYHPNLVFMWVGTNDDQNIHGMSNLGEPPYSPEWKRAYMRKMLEIVTICKRHQARLVFITPPVMPDGIFNNKLAEINSVMLYVCGRYKVEAIDGRKLLADGQGKFLREIKLPNGSTATVRTPDTVHITEAGNRIIMQRVILPRLYFYIYGSASPKSGGPRGVVPTNKHGGASISGGR